VRDEARHGRGLRLRDRADAGDAHRARRRSRPSAVPVEVRMKKLERSIVVERDAESVFELISDPIRFPEFFKGITRWELCSQKQRGLGAEYRVLMRVGSIEAGGLIRITDWQEPRTIAWKAERGIHQQGRWTVTR